VAREAWVVSGVKCFVSLVCNLHLPIGLFTLVAVVFERG